MEFVVKINKCLTMYTFSLSRLSRTIWTCFGRTRTFRLLSENSDGYLENRNRSVRSRSKLSSYRKRNINIWSQMNFLERSSPKSNECMERSSPKSNECMERSSPKSLPECMERSSPKSNECMERSSPKSNECMERSSPKSITEWLSSCFWAEQSRTKRIYSNNYYFHIKIKSNSNGLSHVKKLKRNN